MRGCAGVFNTINSLETLTQLFDDNGMLNTLENFVSRNGAIHYELPINTQIKLRKKLLLFLKTF